MSRSGMHGVGISYRPEFGSFESSLRELVDCVEVMFEHAREPESDGGEVLRWDIPKALHATSLSPGTADLEPREEWPSRFRDFRRMGATYVSDHLSYTTAGPMRLANFLGVNRSYEEAERIVENLNIISQISGMYVGLENAVTFNTDPRPEMSEAKFLSLIADRSDATIVLDVNNLYVNSVNHGYDPVGYLDELDTSRVEYIHVAGYGELGSTLVDSHSHATSAHVWDLLAHALKTTSASAVVLERDNASATFEELREELEIVRSIWNRERTLR